MCWQCMDHKEKICKKVGNDGNLKADTSRDCKMKESLLMKMKTTFSIYLSHNCMETKCTYVSMKRRKFIMC